MKGRKTGGRKKGARNKSTRTKAALEQHAAAGGVEPLEYLLGIMRGKGKQSRRDWAAAAAAPYVHAKKQSVQLDRTGPPTVIIKNYDLPLPKPTDKPAPLRLVKQAGGAATADD